MSKPKFQISCEAQSGVAVIRIDGIIAEWKDSAMEFKNKIDSLIATGIVDAIVYIKTGGGDCFEANEIVNEIKRFPGTIKAELGSICASAGTYIASNCSYVSAARNCSYMIHKPIGDFNGNSGEIKASLKALTNLEAEYAKSYSEKTGLPVSKIEAMWVEDYWMNSEEAKKLGFINEIIGEAPITDEFIETIKAFGYKNMPTITAFTNETTKKTNIMKELLISASMGALIAGASDAAVLAYFEGLKAKALTADALKTELDNLKKTAAEEKADVVLEAATKAKKITAAQNPFYRKNLIEDFAGTKAMLDAMPSLTKLSAEVEGVKSTEDRSAWTYADYQDKNPEALAELAKTDEAHFKVIAEKHYGTKF
ncbi:MAG: Clp protease ClpP [Bacteroidetes bacterium]|nr:Clp protease ClpP [Bacteroidota bacterium]